MRIDLSGSTLEVVRCVGNKDMVVLSNISMKMSLDDYESMICNLRRNSGKYVDVYSLFDEIFGEESLSREDG